MAPASWHERLAAANAQANPDLFRLCCKMATGAGKTTVMALVIAWQAINHARMGAGSRFANRFLLVAPGITIKDRLRVLLPSDPDNYYETRKLVPRDMLDDLRKARVVITNYHAFKRKERLQAPKLTRQILGGRDGEASFLESEGQMLARVCPRAAGRQGRRNRHQRRGAPLLPGQGRGGGGQSLERRRRRRPSATPRQRACGSRVSRR